jgi:hypothetical protein
MGPPRESDVRRDADDDRDDEGAAEDGAADGPAVGDVVVVPYARVREQIGCGERAGVVLEDRRNVVKIFFPDIERAFWLDRAHLVSVAEDRLPLHPLTSRLHRACRALHAEHVEIDEPAGDADVFHLYTRGTDLAALESVRDLLGADLRRVGVDPGGVRRARITLVFRTAKR